MEHRNNDFCFWLRGKISLMQFSCLLLNSYIKNNSFPRLLSISLAHFPKISPLPPNPTKTHKASFTLRSSKPSWIVFIKGSVLQIGGFLDNAERTSGQKSGEADVQYIRARFSLISGRFASVDVGVLSQKIGPHDITVLGKGGLKMFAKSFPGHVCQSSSRDLFSDDGVLGSYCHPHVMFLKRGLEATKDDGILLSWRMLYCVPARPAASLG